MALPGQLGKHAGYQVKHHFASWKALRDGDKKFAYRSRAEIHEKTLRDDEHAKTIIDMIHPCRFESTHCEMPKTLGRHDKAFAHPDGVWEVHRQPSHCAVIDTVCLRLESFTERNYKTTRVDGEPLTQYLIDFLRADRSMLRGYAEIRLKIVINGVVNSDAVFIPKRPIGARGCVGSLGTATTAWFLPRRLNLVADGSATSSRSIVTCPSLGTPRCSIPAIRPSSIET